MAMTYTFYSLAAIALVISFIKDKDKTKKSLIKAWKSFENILPQFIIIILSIGMVLSVVNSETISTIIGNESGFLGLFLATAIGAVTLVPSFVAFPLAANLLESGAGYMQIAAFISSLMMVGIITIPLEKKYFQTKATLLRNSFALIFSIIVGLIMGVILA